VDIKDIFLLIWPELFWKN